MTDTIRERIIQAVVTRCADMTSAKGYATSIGTNVRRADTKVATSDLPACVVWPLEEQVAAQSGGNVCTMQVKIDGAQLFGSTNPSVVAEQMLADIIECLTAYRWTVPFDSGGTYVPQVGDILTGSTSAAVGYIQAVTVSSGSWAGGNAAGLFVLRRVDGIFRDAEALSIGAHVDVATVDGTPTAQTPVTAATSGLAEKIQYSQGGPTSYPDGPEIVVGSGGLFQLTYRTKIGNPYSQ